MSIPSQDVYLNLTTPLSVVGSGGSSGPGVDAIVSGANISTLGASVGDVTVALQPNLTNINSVAFSAGGAVTGLSTINGSAVGSVNPNLTNISSIAFVTGGAVTGLSTINGSAVGSVNPNPTFSTISLASIGAITSANVENTQTFNTVIGNMRLQGGTVSATTAGTEVTWATAFSSAPIVTTGCASGGPGLGKIITVSADSSTANFSVNSAELTVIQYLAVGAV